MTLRQPFRPLRPDLDRFLFAEVGNEVEGVPLSVISALTRLGLDPWEEAGRLSSFSDREATEQLARLIGDLRGHADHRRDAREIATGLVALLPAHGASPKWAPQVEVRPRFWPQSFPRPSQFWVACFVVAMAVLLSAVLRNGLPFGIGGS